MGEGLEEASRMDWTIRHRWWEVWEGQSCEGGWGGGGGARLTKEIRYLDTVLR